MHCVLEGVTRWLLKTWTDSFYHSSPFDIGRSITQIDTQLLKQKPPQEASRPPCSIKVRIKKLVIILLTSIASKCFTTPVLASLCPIGMCNAHTTR